MIRAVLFLFTMLVMASCHQKINSVQDVMSAMAPEEQRSMIDPTVDNVIKGEKGTQIFIPANALRFKNGTIPTGKVRIQLKEFFSVSEFISNNLSTVSDTFLLETNGMLYISATADGKELVIDNNKSYTIAFPKTDSTQKMELFYGDSASGTINWQTAFPAGNDFVFPFDSLLMDTSLLKREVSICSYVSEVLGDPLLWRIDHPDSTMFVYFSKNFKIADTTFINALCKQGEIPGIRLEIDKNGKIKEVYLDAFEGHIGRAPETIRKRLKEVFLSFPNFKMESMSPGQEAYLNLSICCHTVFDQEKYMARFDQKYSQYRNKAIEKMDKGELGSFIFSAARFGWINCDRFLDDSTEKIDYIVKAPSADAKTFIVFENINSIMAGNYANGSFVFPNVPLNSKIKVIGINFENGKPGMAVLQNVVSKNVVNLSGFKSFTISELEKQLNKSL